MKKSKKATNGKRHFVSIPVRRTLKEKLERVARRENRPLAQLLRPHLESIAKQSVAEVGATN